MVEAEGSQVQRHPQLDSTLGQPEKHETVSKPAHKQTEIVMTWKRIHI